jgi:predicted secreted protein
MAITTAIAIYFLIWWIVLFAVLPWGVRPQGDEGAAGTDPGAPRVPHLKAKLVWTTVVATALFAASAYAYVYRLVTLDGLAGLLGTPF